jgi:hypothetical protein
MVVGDTYPVLPDGCPFLPGGPKADESDLVRLRKESGDRRWTHVLERLVAS